MCIPTSDRGACKAEEWRLDYNIQRPCESLVDVTAAKNGVLTGLNAYRDALLGKMLTAKRKLLEEEQYIIGEAIKKLLQERVSTCVSA